LLVRQWGPTPCLLEVLVGVVGGGVIYAVLHLGLEVADETWREKGGGNQTRGVTIEIEGITVRTGGKHNNASLYIITLYRPGRRVTKGTDGVSLDGPRYFIQHRDLPLVGLSVLHLHH
jgi:hypothetical protein